MERLTLQLLVVILSLYLMGKTILIIVHSVTYYLHLHNTISFLINVIFCQVKMLTLYIVPNNQFGLQKMRYTVNRYSIA